MWDTALTSQIITGLISDLLQRTRSHKKNIIYTSRHTGLRIEHSEDSGSIIYQNQNITVK